MSKNKVGYCNPPIESRFKKGHSGNIKGRPKGDKNINTLLKKEVNEKLPAVINGKEKKVTKKELIVKNMINNAIKNKCKLQDICKLINMIQEAEAADERKKAYQDNLKDTDREILESFVKQVIEKADKKKNDS